MTPVAQVRDLSAGYRRHGRLTTVLHGIDLQLLAGRTTVVVGESGSGKSTLARVLTGQVAPFSGSVELPRSRGRRAPGPVQLVPQDPTGALDPRLSVGASVVEGHRGRRGEQARAALERVGLDPDLAARRPGGLSGGQRQRVVIARALEAAPELLVCDEPTSALDVSVQAGIVNLLDDLQRAQGFAMLFITHDLTLARYLADDVLVLHRGQVVEAGTAELLDDPQMDYTRQLAASSPAHWIAGVMPDPPSRQKESMR